MKSNFSQLALLTMAGIQIIIIICLYALERRMSILESSHENPIEQK